MITRKDALAIGKAVAAGAEAEKENCFYRKDECYAINGATHRMLQNFWYDVLTGKVKESFDWDCQKFIDEVWKA